MAEQQGVTTLSVRLRELRAEHWPGHPTVTQRQLAVALGVSVPLISSWETAQAIPGEDRLQSYARFFATRRSLDGKRPRLTEERELTDAEQQEQRRLFEELLALRRTALEPSSGRPQTGALGGRFYHFPDGKPVRIIGRSLPNYELRRVPPEAADLLRAAREVQGALRGAAARELDEAIAEIKHYPAIREAVRSLVAAAELVGHEAAEERSASGGEGQPPRPVDILGDALATFQQVGVQYANPWHPNAILSLWHGDMDAIIELVGHVRAENPGSDVRWMLDSEVTADDLTVGHVIILGGGDSLLSTPKPAPLSFLHADLGLPVRTALPPDGDPEYDWYFEVSVDEDGRPDKTGTRVQTFAPRFLLDENGARVYDHGEPLLDHDIALLLRSTNPLNTATLTICTGIFSRGSYGAVRAMTDATRRADNEHFVREDMNMSDFWMLVEVPVFYSPQGGVTLTPDLRQRHRIRTFS